MSPCIPSTRQEPVKQYHLGTIPLILLLPVLIAPVERREDVPFGWTDAPAGTEYRDIIHVFYPPPSILISS